MAKSWKRLRERLKKRKTTTEYFEPCSKKGRGRSQKSIDLIEAMYAIAEVANPITVRGIGYKLFTGGLIPSMAKNEMQRVYRLGKEAREEGIIPWHWIVDETRELEKVATWDDPKDFVASVRVSYRRDFWKHQPVRVLVVSEKGTVRGVLKPTLDDLGVGFLPLHGFSGATPMHDLAIDYDGRPLILLYVGDYDPSGMWMSERDLPERLERYGGHHITIRRIAIVEADHSLPSFPAADKKKDPRYEWFVANYGDRCWELDAMDPNDLRDRVEAAIKNEIEPVAWARCEQVGEAELYRRSLIAGPPPSEYQKAIRGSLLKDNQLRGGPTDRTEGLN